MSGKTLDAAIRQQYEKCREYGKKLAESFELEAIHEFRVETKRLRALLRLAASAAHSHIKPRLPRNLKAFYTLTGILRNLQLQRKAIEDTAARLHQGPPAICLAVLDDRIVSARKMISIYLLGNNPFGKPRPEWHNPISLRIANDAREKFITGKTKILASSVTSSLPDDEPLHDIRKNMKDLLYAWPWFSRNNIRQALDNGLPHKKNLHEHTDLLGDLLDVNTRLSLLQDKTFLLCSCPASATFIEDAGKLWSLDKLKLLDKIKTALTPVIVAAAENPDAAPPASMENPLSPVSLPPESYELHID